MSTPFDLHVLSTPPAFILSQDQTLNKMVSKELSFLKSILLKLNSSFKEMLTVVSTSSFELYNQFILVLRVCHVV